MNLEPGYQIAYCAIERSIKKGFKHFDFLRGDEPYKSRWNTRRKPIQRIRFIPRNPLANIKHGLWLTGRSIKNYVRPGTLNPDAGE
jgi:dihydrodipicolinate synthase/N-acetylneuraminate lyase